MRDVRHAGRVVAIVRLWLRLNRRWCGCRLRVSNGLRGSKVDNNAVASTLRLRAASRCASASALTVWPWQRRSLHAAAIAIAVVAQVTLAAVGAGRGCADGLDDNSVGDVVTRM